jgi:hypothetical protein
MTELDQVRELLIRLRLKIMAQSLETVLTQAKEKNRDALFVLHQLAVAEAELEKTDLEILDRFLEGTDMIFDSSANLNVNHLMSDLAREMGISYLAISTTYGAWGGHIVRIWPGKTRGCWLCYRHWLEEGRIPFARSDPNGEVQPGGCGTPTYTGAGFDAQEIALGGIRVAVSFLTREHTKGYSAIDWDVAVVNLRDDAGHSIPPNWQTFTLEKHPSCSCGENHPE